MNNMNNDVIKLLIRVLAGIVLVNALGTLALLWRGVGESSALLGLANTAVGGLIGLLVNPNTGGNGKTTLAAAGDVNVSVPASVETAETGQ